MLGFIKSIISGLILGTVLYLGLLLVRGGLRLISKILFNFFDD